MLNLKLTENLRITQLGLYFRNLEQLTKFLNKHYYETTTTQLLKILITV